MDFKLLHLVATVIETVDHRPGPGPGHPPTDTIRVVATLQRFLREAANTRTVLVGGAAAAAAPRPSTARDHRRDQTQDPAVHRVLSCPGSHACPGEGLAGRRWA